MNEINKALEALRSSQRQTQSGNFRNAQRFIDEAIECLTTIAAADAGADEALERTMIERDFREDVINAILDEVLGLDRSEWSSNYDFNDAISDVKERMWALTKPAPKDSRDAFEAWCPSRKLSTIRRGPATEMAGEYYYLSTADAWAGWQAGAAFTASAQVPAAGQCGESCERAKLCGACARGLDVVPEPAASEREAFEAWALDQWGDRPVPNNAWLGWQGRAAIAASHPAPPESDVKDAARYRWLRRGGTSKLDSEREEMVKSYGDHYLDEAIDAAMSASNQNGGE